MSAWVQHDVLLPGPSLHDLRRGLALCPHHPLSGNARAQGCPNRFGGRSPAPRKIVSVFRGTGSVFRGAESSGAPIMGGAYVRGADACEDGELDDRRVPAVTPERPEGAAGALHVRGAERRICRGRRAKGGVGSEDRSVFRGAGWGVLTGVDLDVVLSAELRQSARRESLAVLVPVTAGSFFEVPERGRKGAAARTDGTQSG